MTRHVFLDVEAESESIVTQNTIVIKTIGNSLQVLAGDYDLATQMTVLGIFQSLFMWFLEMNSSPHIAQIYGLFQA